MRAKIRAKVNVISAQQAICNNDRKPHLEALQKYLNLVKTYVRN